MRTIEGNRKDRKVLLYAISTCGWCRKTKKLLQSMDIQYSFVDIDLIKGEEKDRVMTEMAVHNPRKSAPTMVIDDGTIVIVGHNEDKVREALG